MARECGYLKCVVATRDGRTFRFDGKLYVSHRRSDREIEAAFYAQGGFVDVDGPRYEIEVTSLPWGHLGVSRALVHVHMLPGTTREFVCYVPPVTTEAHARELFTWWCLGTVYTAETGVAFDTIVEAHPDDMPAFLERQLGIVLKDDAFQGA